MSDEEFARLHQACSNGDQTACEELWKLVYDGLCEIAHCLLATAWADHELSEDDVVAEAFLRLVDNQRITCQSQAHFCALSATFMRRILIDYARRRNAHERATQSPIPLDEDPISLDEALRRLAGKGPRQRMNGS